MNSKSSIARRLLEAEATISALLSGEIDAVVDERSHTPVLLANAQGALRESEERYRRIVETSNDGIGVLDANAKLTFVNQRLADLLGYPADVMLHRSLSSFLVDPTQAAATLLLEHSRGDVAEHDDVGFLRGDGTTLWALLRTSPIRGSDESPGGTLAMVTDRTRHRQDERDLRRSEEQYRLIVEATADGIVTVDAEARITFANGRFAELLGRRTETLPGTSIFGFMSPASHEQLASEFLPHPEKEALDTAFVLPDGSEVHVNLVATFLVDSDGRHIGNLAMVRDVTERKKLESALRVSDRMASLGTLAAGMAHEINNPLAVVAANLEYVRQMLDQERGTHDAWFLEHVLGPLDDAREAAERVRLIVRDLRIFSRSPPEQAGSTADVETIMDSSLRMCQNEVRHRARLVRHYGSVPPVQANEARLGQVFLNLLVNAAHAIPEGHADDNEITIVTQRIGSRVVVEVRDTGVGIAPSILGRVFDPFFTTKAVGVGTGLGLAICQRIVSDVGGELTVESVVGKGTAFRVSLPLAQETDAQPPVVVAARPAPTVARRGRILIVDDEVPIARTLLRILSRDHDVEATVSALETLRRCLAGERFDVILCDVMMPDMTGIELHRALLDAVPEQALRMVFMTGGAFTGAAQTFLASVPNEHVDKPFDHDALRALLRRYV